MPAYRHQLPQLTGGVFLTDGGIETTLIYDDGFDLPDFAAFPSSTTPPATPPCSATSTPTSTSPCATGSASCWRRRRGGPRPTGAPASPTPSAV